MSADVESSLPAARGLRACAAQREVTVEPGRGRWWTDCQSHGGIRRIGKKGKKKKKLQCLTFNTHYFWEITSVTSAVKKQHPLHLVYYSSQADAMRFLIQIKWKCSGVKRSWLEAGVVFQAELRQSVKRRAETSFEPLFLFSFHHCVRLFVPQFH